MYIITLVNREVHSASHCMFSLRHCIRVFCSMLVCVIWYPMVSNGNAKLCRVNSPQE